MCHCYVFGQRNWRGLSSASCTNHPFPFCPALPPAWSFCSINCKRHFIISGLTMRGEMFLRTWFYIPAPFPFASAQKYWQRLPGPFSIGGGGGTSSAWDRSSRIVLYLVYSFSPRLAHLLDVVSSFVGESSTSSLSSPLSLVPPSYSASRRCAALAKIASLILSGEKDKDGDLFLNFLFQKKQNFLHEFLFSCK